MLNCVVGHVHNLKQEFQDALTVIKQMAVLKQIVPITHPHKRNYVVQLVMMEPQLSEQQQQRHQLPRKPNVRQQHHLYRLRQQPQNLQYKQLQQM